MPTTNISPTRFIGLDIHKEYLVAVAVDRDQNVLFGPQRVPLTELEEWMHRRLTPQDAVALEMTTNAWTLYDELQPHVHSVTVVHPPHVALIVRAQVKTDRKAALALAQLHAAGLLVPIWVPPQEVRDLRALLAQRFNMVRLVGQARIRLHAVLHRHHLLPPDEGDLFAEAQREWWLNLPVSGAEKVRIQSDWDTLFFAKRQVALLEDCLGQLTVEDERLPLLLQLPGVGFLAALTLLAAIGDIRRFPSAAQLVGYAGLGARVHDSGMLHQTGRITKAGRRDMRRVLIQAAQAAARTHPYWKGQMARLEPRLGRKKAIVAIARKLLVAVWHVLSKQTVDRYARSQQVACSFFAYAYRVGVANLPEGQSAKGYTRAQLDRLGLGAELTEIPWGTKRVKLPPSHVSKDLG